MRGHYYERQSSALTFGARWSIEGHDKCKDLETVMLLRGVLEGVWERLTFEQRAQTRKPEFALRILLVLPLVFAGNVVATLAWFLVGFLMR